jgi:hypothetical protein
LAAPARNPDRPEVNFLYRRTRYARTDFTALQDLHGIEVLLTPMQQFTRLVFAAFCAIRPHDHCNQTTLAINSRGYQVKPAPEVWPVFSHRYSCFFPTAGRYGSAG